ncbi:MAG: bifunctional biotin--[acetyl-CoA-carboxylase] ligase/biotin operon repressor BirA [Proteobacteria bacterium]|jgi:BirA family transcriptional regulator, biotin operon repressor / biotin---[acetyl-CoA-carboxylase] ligase|nr:bifunctional biotin--[acetyl-CoA-carboxylase] ligase/biotin operon repressor BirA [Pseudomonadota bacterium]
METTISVVQKLADGRFHSGSDLGRSLGISRAAVWKSIQKIKQEWRLSVHAVPGKGYRLADPLQLLDSEIILAQLAENSHSRLDNLKIVWSTDSTNRLALELVPLRTGHVVAVLAEHQSAGRGRRGRRWESPFGHNLYLSLAGQFGMDLSNLPGLSLVVALAVLRTLHRCDAQGIGLKWPNDVLWENRKLCGVLLEMQGESAGPWQVVMGIGLNLVMEEHAGKKIDRPWVDLRTVLGHDPARNWLAGKLLDELIGMVEEFQQQGLDPFLSEWRSHDVTRNQPVVLQFAEGSVRGIARGIDRQGALLLETDGVVRAYHAGEVSLRYG